MLLGAEDSLTDATGVPLAGAGAGTGGGDARKSVKESATLSDTDSVASFSEESFSSEVAWEERLLGVESLRRILRLRLPDPRKDRMSALRCERGMVGFDAQKLGAKAE